MAAKLKRKEKGLSLDTFELTDSAARNVLISTVKQMFEKGTIHTLAAAEQLIGQIQDGDMDKVDAALVRLDVSANKKSAKRQANEMAQDSELTVAKGNKQALYQNSKQEQRTADLRGAIQKVHTTFEAAWKDGAASLVRIAADKIREKQH